MYKKYSSLLVIVLSFFIMNCSEDVVESEDVVDPIISDGLVAFYPFSGNANDLSGNGNDGIINWTTLTTDRFGKTNSAFRFIGQSFIQIPELLPDSCQGLTISAWVSKEDLDNKNHMIFYKGIKQGEAALLTTEGMLGFRVNLKKPGSETYSQNWYSANIADTLKANTYYLIVGRYRKGQSIDLSINGVQVSNEYIPDLKLVADNLRTFSAIGNHSSNTHVNSFGWKGTIDDIRVYSRSLTDQEIIKLYNEGGWAKNK